MRWQKHINVIFVEIFISEIEKGTTGWNSKKTNGNGYIESGDGYDIRPDCESDILNLIKERNKNETAEKTDQESEGTAGEE